MPGFYQTFTSLRLTEPDAVSLFNQLRALDSTAGVQHTPGTNTYVIKKNSDWLPAHITAAQNVIDNAPPISPQLTAQNIIDNMPIFEKALLLTLLDQINVLRTRAGLATITVQQAIQAVRDKAGTL